MIGPAIPTFPFPKPAQRSCPLMSATLRKWEKGKPGDHICDVSAVPRWNDYHRSTTPRLLVLHATRRDTVQECPFSGNQDASLTPGLTLGSRENPLPRGIEQAETALATHCWCPLSPPITRFSPSLRKSPATCCLYVVILGDIVNLSRDDTPTNRRPP
jgi:hypothetical protein